MKPRTLNMPRITYVVARSYPDHVIGCENRLPWRMKSDLQYFRALTTDHAVIMGRKTFDSIGRPLPNRKNVVLSSQSGNDGRDLFWVQGPNQALFLADYLSILMGKKQLFVIGGENVYNLFSDLYNAIVLTEIYGDFPKGDAFFREEFDRRKWKCVEEKEISKDDDNQFPARITIFERKISYVRQRNIDEFLTRDESAERWQLKKMTELSIERYSESPEEQIELPHLAA